MRRTLIIVLASAALGACETSGVGAQTGPAYMPPSRLGPESFQESDFAWSAGSGGGRGCLSLLRVGLAKRESSLDLQVPLTFASIKLSGTGPP